MTLPDHADVVIVGGGPVGLALATELAFHGVASVIIERRADVSLLRPRAKTTSARSMEHFRRWGLASEIRARAGLPVRWSDEAVFCTSLLGREITRIERCFGLDLTGSDLVAEPGQQIAQPIVEQVLRESAAARGGLSQLLTGFTAVAVGERRDAAWVDVEDTDGRTHRIQAEWVVGCEGARSLVRDAIGARYEGSDDHRPNFSVLFRAPGLAERVPHGPAVHYWVLSASQPGIMGRLNLQDLWWCGANGVDAATGEANAAAIVGALIGGQADIEVLSTDAWRARMLLADRWSSGRLFIAGDAAHQNPPWGGHGFNTGLGDAVNLGWKLAAVVTGWAPRAILSSYESERRPVAEHTIDEATANMAALSRELVSVLGAASDDEFDQARGDAAAAIRTAKDSEFHSLDLTLGYSYADSPIVIGEKAIGENDRPGPAAGYVPSAAPGGRLPHWWLGDGTSLYDKLGPEFTLVGDRSAAAASGLLAAARTLGIPLQSVDLDAAQCQRRFDAPLVLVRPDQHVAWRGAGLADPERILRRAVGAG
jgi:2-polyprenyl-6-methoxyphenol hydroxylase-like FAD-dependent oxidoreductase